MAPWTLDPGPWTLDPGPWTLDPGPWTLDPGPWTLDPGLLAAWHRFCGQRSPVGSVDRCQPALLCASRENKKPRYGGASFIESAHSAPCRGLCGPSRDHRRLRMADPLLDGADLGHGLADPGLGALV
ncbi:TPA: hypothetical protein L6B70_29470 [Pseudomonas aeruginosa]|nr:hypothetical protein [Pseudomonas aeruginosa]